MIAEIALYPSQASSTAAEVDWVFLYLVSICGAVGLMVATLLIGFCIRYRRRPGESGAPPETKSSDALEWFWTLTPLLFFASMFIWGARVYFAAFRAPDDAPVVYVVGKQWMWKFQHPEGQREIDALHVPVGQPVKLIMTSEDVIHSFFVPNFRVHMDVLPKRYTSVWFKPTRAGSYHLFCSQYCGTNHAAMTGEVIAMPPHDYQNWLRLHAEGSLALQGRKVFLKYRCDSCHSADAAARAPVLEDLFGRAVTLNDGRVATADENYLRESILNPSAKIVAGWENLMPTFQGQVSEEEIIELIAYIKSLKRGETPPRVESYPPPQSTPPINPQE